MLNPIPCVDAVTTATLPSSRRGMEAISSSLSNPTEKKPCPSKRNSDPLKALQLSTDGGELMLPTFNHRLVRFRWSLQPNEPILLKNPARIVAFEVNSGSLGACGRDPICKRRPLKLRSRVHGRGRRWRWLRRTSCGVPAAMASPLQEFHALPRIQILKSTIFAGMCFFSFLDFIPRFQILESTISAGICFFSYHFKGERGYHPYGS